MTDREFARIRARLAKTQKELASLLGVSIKAVHSYEQGWRQVPAHVERQLFYLLASKTQAPDLKPCWEIKGCPPPVREACPAWEFKSGHLCWFINGTMCQGSAQKDWAAKMALCRECSVLLKLLKD